jgi:hypothetical protein
MKLIKLINEDLDLELDLNIKDSWQEITFQQYIELSKLDISKQGDIDTTLNQICILTDAKKEDIVNYSVDEILKISKVIEEGIASNPIPKFKDRFIYIDGVMYVIKSNYSSVVLSEQIYIQNIMENIKDELERSLLILAILIRPGYSKEVDGNIRYIQHILDGDDIEHRKDLFRTKLPVVLALSVLESFTNGTVESLNNTKSSSPVPHRQVK